MRIKHALRGSALAASLALAAAAGCDTVPTAESSAPMPAAPEPAPTQAAPQTPQATKQVPDPKSVRPALTRVALDTELLFDFDSAELRAAGRGKLDEIAQKVHGAVISGIEATGHADRIASEAYNQDLSERRARAVAAYLGTLGFDGKLISAAGRGEAQPVTGARCEGLGAENGGNLKLVACLQPDRRVEVEILGTRRGNS